MAEKKRPKAESFFQSKAPELGTSDEDTGHPKKEDAPVKVRCPHPGSAGGWLCGCGADQPVPQGEQFVYHEDWGETLSTRSVPVLCVLDIEGNSISVLEGIPEHLSPGQVRMELQGTREGRFQEPATFRASYLPSPHRLSGRLRTLAWCSWAGGTTLSAWGCGTAQTAGESPQGTPCPTLLVGPSRALSPHPGPPTPL